jgi:RimJ/RimL family protein N-acetyltransferase
MAEHGLSDRARRADLSRTVLLDAQEWALRLVCDVLGTEPDIYTPCLAVGIVRDATLVAGVVYHDWRPRHGDVSMTIASRSPRWATRGVIAWLLQYPFVELDCRRISTTVRDDNLHAQRFNERLGFHPEGRRLDFFEPGVDCIEYGMMREEWAAGPYRWE